MLELKPYPLGSRALFGNIIPSHDSGYGSYEFEVMAPEGVTCIDARAMVRSVKVEELLKAQKDAVNEALKLATAHPTVINYIATATCFVLGNEGEAALVRAMEEATGIPCTAGGIAVVDAIKSFGAKKIICYTPYVPEVAQVEKTYFQNAGLEVIGQLDKHFANPTDINHVDPLRILADIVHLYDEHPDAEAVFCVGGCFRTVGIIGDIEKIIGIPVIGTQQANMWKMLKMASIGDQMPQFGRLLGARRL